MAPVTGRSRQVEFLARLREDPSSLTSPHKPAGIRWQGIGFGVEGDDGVISVHETYPDPSKEADSPGDWTLPITNDNACEHLKTLYRSMDACKNISDLHKIVEHYFAPDASFSHSLFFVRGWDGIKAWYNQAYLFMNAGVYVGFLVSLLYNGQVRFGRAFYDDQQGILFLEIIRGASPKYFGPTSFIPLLSLFYLEPRTDGKPGLWIKYQEDHYMSRGLLTTLITSPFTYIVDGFLRPWNGKLVTALHQLLGLI